jgi:hypothetical protein
MSKTWSPLSEDEVQVGFNGLNFRANFVDQLKGSIVQRVAVSKSVALRSSGSSRRQLPESVLELY